MIESIDAAVSEWIRSVEPGCEVAHEPPSAEVERARVSLYLLDVRNDVPGHRQGARSMDLLLSYLLCVSHPDPVEAHRAFGRILLAALAHKDYRAELLSAESPLWSSLRVLPRPAILLRCPWRIEAEPVRQRVRFPPQVRMAPVTMLRGSVLTADDRPVVRARVELCDLPATAFTDAEGRFELASPGISDGAHPFRVVAKGAEVRVEPFVRAGEPIVIRLDPKET